MSEPATEPLSLTVAVPAGRIVVRQEDPIDRCWVVVSGALRESCLSADGREFSTGILGPGSGFGVEGSSRSPTEVRAMVGSKIRVANGSESTSILLHRERRILELACELVWLDARSRIEKTLDDLADRFGRPAANGFRIGVPLTQTDLASLAGTTRERANRILRDLSAEERIVREGRFYVVRPALRSVV
jgi:CRP/FNR family cyclic AMP-dependent transcriptional regulator